MIVNRLALLANPPIVNMFHQKLKCSVTGASYGLAEVGYDIRLKQDIWFNPGSHTTIQHEENGSFRQEIKHGNGRFILASAIEEFDMPPDLVGIVHDKSTWAREGLSVFNTVIEPGWRGWLTLELVYHGDKEFHIPAGAGIAQVIFHKLTTDAYYDGHYQDQENRPVKSIASDI